MDCATARREPQDGGFTRESGTVAPSPLTAGRSATSRNLLRLGRMTLAERRNLSTPCGASLRHKSGRFALCRKKRTPTARGYANRPVPPAGICEGLKTPLKASEPENRNRWQPGTRPSAAPDPLAGYACPLDLERPAGDGRSNARPPPTLRRRAQGSAVGHGNGSISPPLPACLRACWTGSTQLPTSTPPATVQKGCQIGETPCSLPST